MPQYQFDKKFGNVHIATHKFRVRNNLRTFRIPLQVTKGSEVRVSGVKLPKYYVIGIFAAGKPMTIRLKGKDDLASLPEFLRPVKAVVRDFLEEMG